MVSNYGRQEMWEGWINCFMMEWIVADVGVREVAGKNGAF